MSTSRILIARLRWLKTVFVMSVVHLSLVDHLYLSDTKNMAESTPGPSPSPNPGKWMVCWNCFVCYYNFSNSLHTQLSAVGQLDILNTVWGMLGDCWSSHLIVIQPLTLIDTEDFLTRVWEVGGQWKHYKLLSPSMNGQIRMVFLSQCVVLVSV